jgi:hypothetical protein
MLPLSFLYAAALLGLGILGLNAGATPDEARALGLPGLYFGGGVLLCSFFALREPRHGLAGASFLAFIAFVTNSGTLFTPLARGSYAWSEPELRLSTFVWGASAIYLACAVRWWKRRRRADALANLRGEGDKPPQ